MLKELIRNTKPEIILSVSDDTLTDKEAWELRDIMIERACGFNPLHHGYIAE